MATAITLRVGSSLYGSGVRHVAFLRNVNQGQRGHPSSAEIIAAFTVAGCPDARTFRSNGTVVFGSDEPQGVAEDAAAALAALGFERQVFLMPLEEVARIARRHESSADVNRMEFTLHRGGIVEIGDPSVEHVAAHRRVRFLEAGDGWLVCLNERDREGNATPVAERVTQGPATSRAMTTIARLAVRLV